MLDITIQTNIRELSESTNSAWFEKVRSGRFMQVIITIMDSQNHHCLNREIAFNLESEAFNVIIIEIIYIIEFLGQNLQLFIHINNNVHDFGILNLGNSKISLGEYLLGKINFNTNSVHKYYMAFLAFHFTLLHSCVDRCNN
jgi:hypothetical protein